MTALDTGAIRRRHAASTEGVWQQGSLYDGEFIQLSTSGRVRIGAHSFSVVEAPAYNYADAEFIAHAHQDVPALLDLIEEMAARPASLRDQISQYLRSQIFGDDVPLDECDSEADHIVEMLTSPRAG